MGKVRKLLLNLGALNIVEEKTRLAARIIRSSASRMSSSPKASGTRVDIVTPARTWALIVGKSSSAKSGYVRVVGAEQSLLAAPLLSVDADPKAWLEQRSSICRQRACARSRRSPRRVPAFSASRDKKDDSNFTVGPLPKGRALTGPGAAQPLAGALSSLTLDDVHKAGGADAQAAHALFRTFDGLEVDVAGRKDGTHSLVTISARSTAPETAAEAQKLNARVGGWEFEIPDYKYTAIFTPLGGAAAEAPRAGEEAREGACGRQAGRDRRSRRRRRIKRALRSHLRHDRERPSFRVAKRRHPFLGAVGVAMNQVRSLAELHPARA